MKKTVALVAFLVAMLFSSGAMAGTYVVRAGDTLSGIAKKSGIKLAFVKLANPKIKNINHIVIGQVINLPESYASSVARRSTAVAGGAVQQEKKVGPWNPGSNPWRLGNAEGIKRLHFSPSGERELLEAVQKNNYFSAAYIHKDGRVIDDFGNEYRMILMGFGKGKFFQPIPAWKDPNHIEVGWIYKAGSEYVLFPFICRNPTFIELVKENPPPEVPVGEVPKEPEEPVVPPIFKEELERSRGVYTHELDLGGGVWRNQDNTANGDWWYGQYKLFLEEFGTGLAGGTLTPVIGAFAKGDRGSTDAGYDWNNWGIGPQAGFMWNGQTAKGYPQQVQFMLRAIYFHMHGHNGWSGYSKEQEHILVGYYLEYIRRFHPKYMTILYAEGWFDADSSFTSTWSGDKVNDLTQFNVGAKLHRDLTESWAARVGIQFGYQIEEDRFGLNVNAELRYDEWLIFGPSFDYCISSDVVNEAGGWAAGVFARVELKKQITEKYTEYRMKKVSASDKQLLEY